jgi:peptide/nickel transport system permease protein
MSGRYLARKGAQAILTIIAIVVLNFVLFRMMPGSPERVLLRNQYLTQEKIDQVRAEWGLDKPLIPDQLVGYINS